MKTQKLKIPLLTQKELQRDRENSVIRHIHNGVQEQKGKDKKEKTKKFLLNTILLEESQLAIAKQVRENADQTLLDLVVNSNENDMYRFSKVVLIKVIIIKKQRKRNLITEDTINELLQKSKKELVQELM